MEMKRILVAAAVVAAAFVFGAAASLASAELPDWSRLAGAASGGPRSAAAVLAGQRSALVRGGLSTTAAARAIAVQDRLAQAGLLGGIEAALGGDYAGVWREPATAKLHGGVTSPAGERTVADLAARTGLAGAVVANPVHSTWAQLEAAQRQWNDRLAGLFARARVETALDPARNA